MMLENSLWLSWMAPISKDVPHHWIYYWASLEWGQRASQALYSEPPSSLMCSITLLCHLLTFETLDL